MRTEVSTASGGAFAVRIIAVVVLAPVLVVAGVGAAATFRGASTGMGLLGALVAGLIALVLFRGAATGARWAIAGLVTAAVGGVSLSLISLFPPTTDQLASATALIHGSDLRADRQLRSAGYSQSTESFCPTACERRFEQSDFNAGVDQAVTDIERRLRGAGYATTRAPGAGWFLNYEPAPGTTVVIDGKGKGLKIMVSVAATGQGSVVASVVE